MPKLHGQAPDSLQPQLFQSPPCWPACSLPELHLVLLTSHIFPTPGLGSVVLFANQTWYIHSTYTHCPSLSSLPSHPQGSFPNLPRLWLNVLIPRRCSVNMGEGREDKGREGKDHGKRVGLRASQRAEGWSWSGIFSCPFKYLVSRSAPVWVIVLFLALHCYNIPFTEWQPMAVVTPAGSREAAWLLIFLCPLVAFLGADGCSCLTQHYYAVLYFLPYKHYHLAKAANSWLLHLYSTPISFQHSQWTEFVDSWSLGVHATSWTEGPPRALSHIWSSFWRAMLEWSVDRGKWPWSSSQGAGNMNARSGIPNLWHLPCTQTIPTFLVLPLLVLPIHTTPVRILHPAWEVRGLLLGTFPD